MEERGSSSELVFLHLGTARVNNCVHGLRKDVFWEVGQCLFGCAKHQLAFTSTPGGHSPRCRETLPLPLLRSSHRAQFARRAFLIASLRATSTLVSATRRRRTRNKTRYVGIKGRHSRLTIVLKVVDSLGIHATGRELDEWLRKLRNRFDSQRHLIKDEDVHELREFCALLRKNQRKLEAFTDELVRSRKQNRIEGSSSKVWFVPTLHCRGVDGTSCRGRILSTPLTSSRSLTKRRR